MPKVAPYTVLWSPSQRTYELYERQGGDALDIDLESPDWFAWLDEVSAFVFRGRNGTITVKKETRREVCWYAYVKNDGKLQKKSVGKTDDLTLVLLEQVAGFLGAGRGSSPLPEDIPASRSQTGALLNSLRSMADVRVDTEVPVTSRMRQDPLLATKLYVPRPRIQLVHRPHLLHQLRQGMEGSLTLISAPPGSGKTTLLGEWLATSNTPAAWLSLEQDDNGPVRFFSYLIAALQTLDAQIGSTALRFLESPRPAPLEKVLTLLANDIASSNLPRFVLVLDDYHVIMNLSVHAAMTFLLEHLPPQMHIAITTRVDPPLPLSRLRARGQLTEIRSTDLRFTAADVTTFLQNVMNLKLPAGAVEAIERRTEGWIAGVQLAALSLRDRSDVTAFLSAFSGSHRFVLDYLSEEVFLQQPMAVQSFLLQTCILDRLCGSLCEAITGQTESQFMLAMLERANLFVVSLDEERQWYRYHQLFADVLRNRLRLALPAQIPTLHRRASEWFEQHEMISEAVQHALAASDVERAADLIEQCGLDVMLRGRVQTVIDWLNLLPEHLVRTRAQLCIISAGVLMFTHQLTESEERLRDAELCIQSSPLSSELTREIQGLIASMRANMARFIGDVARSVVLGEEALHLLSEDDTLMRAAALVSTAHAFLVNGDVTPAVEHALLTVVAPVLASRNRFSILRIFTLQARLYTLQGRLRKAAQTYEQAIQEAPGTGRLQGLVGSPAYYFGLGNLQYEWNNLDAAAQLLEQGMELLKGPLAEDASVVTMGYITLARVQYVRGDSGQTLKTLDTFIEIARQSSFMPHLIAHATSMRALIELAQGNSTAALQWVKDAGLAIEDELSYLREREYLALVQIQIAQGREQIRGPFLSTALAWLDRLLQDAECKARMGSVIEILVLRALALQARHATSEALLSLKQALTLAQPEGYIRLFADHGRALATLLSLLRETNPDSRYYIQTLLVACLTAEYEHAGTASTAHHPLTAPPASSAQPLLDPLSERELEVLRLIASGASNQAIADQLVVTVNTVKRHVSNVFAKLAVANRTQAMARARELNLVP